MRMVIFAGRANLFVVASDVRVDSRDISLDWEHISKENYYTKTMAHIEDKSDISIVFDNMI